MLYFVKHVNRFSILNEVSFIVKFKCCGLVNYVDWQKNIYFNCSQSGQESCSVPYSCCKVVGLSFHISLKKTFSVKLKNNVSFYSFFLFFLFLFIFFLFYFLFFYFVMQYFLDFLICLFFFQES